MANPFDAFDNQPPAIGAQVPVAPTDGNAGQNATPPSGNPFDQFDGAPTAFGGSTASSAPEGGADGKPASEPASLTSIAKNFGAGLLAGIPNAETFIEGALTPPGFAGKPFGALAAPEDTPMSVGEVAKKGLGMVGLNPDDPSQISRPQNAPERIARMGGEGLSGAVVMPGGGLASNAVMGLGSGVGSGLAREAAPDKYKDLAGTVGGLVGGGLGAVASEAPAAVSSIATHASDYAAPLTQAGRERMAGTALSNAATDPAAAVDAITNAPREIVPGSSPTTFQLTGDMGLGGLERAVAAKNPGAFNDVRADQNAARLDALSNVQAEGHPEAVSSFFRDQLDQLDKDTQTAHDAAATSARTATEGVGGGQPTDVYGAQTQTALQSKLDDIKSNETALWKSVDPDRNMITVASPVKQVFKSVYGDLTPEASIGLAPVEKQISDVVASYGQTLPLQNLVDLRSAVSTAMRDMKSPLQPNAQAYGRLSQLRGGIENAISDSIAQRAATEQQSVASGVMRPEDMMLERLRQEVSNFQSAKRTQLLGTAGGDAGGAIPSGARVLPREMGAGNEAGRPAFGAKSGTQPEGTFLDQATADRLKAATAATSERKQVFGAKPVSQIIQRPGATMPYTMQPGSVASSVWKAGNGGADALGAVLKASPEALEPIKQIAAASLRAKAPDGIINAKHLDQWKTQYAPALNALEKASPGSTAVFDNAAKAGDHLAEVAATRKAALDAYQKEAVGRLLKVEDPADVVKTVGSIFNRADSVKEMRALAQEAAKNPQALEGLRKAVVDYMKDKLISNTEAATSGKNLIKADAFQTFIAKNHTALRQVFNDQEIGSMRAIAQDLKRANRSITAAKLPGGSNTAQDLAAMGANDLKQSILSKIVTHAAGGAAGFLGGGPFGAALGAIGSHVLLGAQEAGIKSVEDLVGRAMLDPDLAKTLMTKAPKKPDTGSGVTLANKLRRMSVMAPMISSGQSTK
jgi:hypothetical protein